MRIVVRDNHRCCLAPVKVGGIRHQRLIPGDYDACRQIAHTFERIHRIRLKQEIFGTTDIDGNEINYCETNNCNN